MATDEFQVLMAQFSEYICHEFSVSDWEIVAMEFGVLDTAQNTKRFFRSYNWADEDMTRRTTQFLRKLRDQDEQLALDLMRRAYRKAGGADAETLQEYPALRTLEDKSENIHTSLPHLPINSEQFISIENISGSSYPGVIQNINQSYRLGIYDGALVLSRKLIESLLKDILRKKYGDQRLDLYYNTNRKEIRSFYKLKENFSNNISDFKPYSDEVSSEFIQALDSIRRTANKEAHSIETNITNNEMEKYSEQIEYVVKVLFRLRENI